MLALKHKETEAYSSFQSLSSFLDIVGVGNK